LKTYLVRRDDRVRKLTIRPIQEDRFEVTIDGSVHEIDVRSYTSDHLSMLVDNRSVEATFAFQGERLDLRIRNEEYALELVDERKKRKRVESADNAAGPEIVKAAMPGKIVGLLVKPGDVIEAKGAVVVMEAMKMENEIACRRGGRVRTVCVIPGQTVEKDAMLVEIDPEIG
jgi:glutaconyl-CoA/methylmalonyl-CoA decarboxylase subunit gamma